MIVQCLMYACQVEPIIPEQEVVSLVKMLHGMAKDFPGTSLLMLLHVITACWAQERKAVKGNKTTVKEKTSPILLSRCEAVKGSDTVGHSYAET